MNHRVYQLPIETSDGKFIAEFSEKGLVRLNFPGHLKTSTSRNDPMPPAIHEWHCLTGTALKRALAGREPERLPPLDLTRGTHFQKRVWQAMRGIPCGQTLSYGEIARAIGAPNAVRAVGGACGANPIPVFVPCHRVVAASGRIGGFSGGLDWKRTLLAREGVRLADVFSAKEQ